MLTIVNCDDFGMASEINYAVQEAHQAGRLNSATLLVNHTATDEAISIARDNPQLGIGLHLDLEPFFNFDSTKYFGRSISDIESGKLVKVLKQESQIEDTIMEQIQKFRSFGLQLSHIDGHNHVHLFPGIFEIVVESMLRLGVTRMRFFKQFYEDKMEVCEDYRKILNRHGILYANSFYDFSYMDLSSPVTHPPVEIMVHLAKAVYDDWRTRQLARIKSKSMSSFIEMHELRIVSYQEIGSANDNRDK